jgi:four helix bundle protein
MQDFKNLDVWRRGHELTVQVYQATAGAGDRRFPGLFAQMRRAAASIPANIAEGCGHQSQAEFARFLQHAIASATELEYHLILARDLELLPLASFAKLDARTTQARQMLFGLMRRVRAQRKPLPSMRKPQRAGGSTSTGNA